MVYGHARMPAWVYSQVFIVFDSVCLILQAAGGGLAGTATMYQFEQRALGTNLMIAGITAQVFIMLVLAGLVLDYALRLRRKWDEIDHLAREVAETKKFSRFLTGLGVAYLAILTRCVYRIPELTGGWGSPLMRDKTGFIVLEGV